MDYKKSLLENKRSRATPTEMARKLYLSYPTAAFADKHDTEYTIRDRVRRLHNVPIASVHVIGSAKTGFSLIKKTDFEAGKSDLDLAVVDLRLFNEMWETAYELSNGYDATKFKDLPDQRTGEIVAGSGRARFLNYLQRGIIAPDFMPSGWLRARIIGDYARISDEYRTHFKKISSFFYANEFFFQEKLKDTITSHWDTL